MSQIIYGTSPCYSDDVPSDANRYATLEAIGGHSEKVGNEIVHGKLDKVVSYNSDNTVRSETNIPLAIRQIEGYGYGINGIVNTCDFVGKKLHKRIDKRAYQSGDESNPDYLTDMVYTYYPLQTEQEVDIAPYVLEDLTIDTAQGGYVVLHQESDTSFLLDNAIRYTTGFESDWEGYLFTIPAPASITGESARKVWEKLHAFPSRYIAQGSWKCNPDVREEIKAYRDDNTRNLTRVTADGMKSNFSFKTIGGITLAEKMEIMDWFKGNESDAKERKITLKFWNDDTSSYDMGTFYRANEPFEIEAISGTDIRYAAHEFALIEY